MATRWVGWVAVAGASLALGCTQDFNEFQLGGRGGTGTAGDASAGAAGITSGGAGGGGTGGGPSGGAAGSGGAGGVAGTGGAECGADSKACGGDCVPLSDPAYGCGSTGCAPCALNHATAACDGSRCAISACEGSFTDCNGDSADGCEVDTSNNPLACGACGRACSLPNATAKCEGSSCQVASCQPGFTDCDGDASNGCEVNTAANPRACGSCGNDCFGQPGNWGCEAGQCVVSSCPTGWGDCSGTGCDVNLMTSLAHCGFCGSACAPPNAIGTCTSGECRVLSCNAGFADCDGDPTNGCERNLATDPDHCGACARACSATGTLSRTCSAGSCQPSCSAGHANCHTPAAPLPDDGCEINLLTNPDHCGACGRACSGAGALARACAGGLCAPTCTTGFGDCSAPAAPGLDNGCETPLGTDVDNCGACGRVCSSTGVAARSCNSGVCTSTCTGTLGNCTQPPAPQPDNGCEVNLQDNISNCGGCGRACSANGTTSLSCSGGLCNPSCQAGRGDCEQPPAPSADNGCESSLATDPDHCGGCGRFCSGSGALSRACTAGSCDPSCAPGFGDCATPTWPIGDDGCETSLLSDIANCGACGRGCSLSGASNTSCDAGSCNPTCQAGRGDCGTPGASQPDDGCEINTLTDTDHCGACSRACSDSGVASKQCSAGSCSSSCDLGFANCQAPGAPSADDGCELNVGAAATTCGSCGNACPSGFVCLTSQCVCNSNDDCGNRGTCRGNGSCRCDRVVGDDQLCQRGEACVADGPLQSKCACNGGAACSAGQTCCGHGCTNLSNNPAHCGACGRHCPPGFACASGGCVCDSNADCNAGSPGTCSSGSCSCGVMSCTAGQRCQPDGTCG